MTIITDCRKWELYLTSYLSKNCSNGMHHIMILKSSYKFRIVFQHVLVVATNIIREVHFII